MASDGAASGTARGSAASGSAASGNNALSGGPTFDAATLDDIVKRLAPRWFLVRDTHAREGTQLVRPRTALTWMRGPLTRSELVRARRAVG